jgi:hypothetical protein
MHENKSGAGPGIMARKARFARALEALWAR